MEKPRRSVGVTVVGWISIVFGTVGIICFLIALIALAFREKVGFDLFKYYSSEREFIGRILYLLYCYVPLFFIGLGILKLKPWARTIAIYLMIIYLLSNILSIFGVYFVTRRISFYWACISIFTIYFLTRPKVKRQFEKRSPEPAEREQFK